jgi:AmmeMemoRadiSam system protein A
MARRPVPAGTAQAAADSAALLSIAAAAIAHGLDRGEPPPLRLAEYPDELQRPGASFVTLLTRGHELRGCIGSLEPRRALAQDLAANAYAAAFSDPRFTPLAEFEVEWLCLEIAVLNPLQALPCGSRRELLAQLRPQMDGLVLEAGAGRRATFLPTVWEALPEPEDFLRELWRKAGLAPGYWSESLCFSRYTTRVIQGTYADARAGVAQPD